MEENTSNVGENPPKTGKFALNYGLILGALFVVFGIMLFLQDAHTSRSSVNQIISIVLMIGVIFWGVFNFRKANGGYLKLGEALKIGTGIALISAIIYIIYMLVLVNVLDTEFPVKVAELQKAAAEEAGVASTEQIQQQYDGTINYFWITYPFILIFNIILGLVIGLIAGLIFKKAKPAY
ncbi:DUF4199 domain-containing protein [Allomuricauda sp. d1]|uniref:DUF4199 domain-containing protein n=1 Tax=Allomuricauda sp. d1 TaxID=3136725 RepID=UPI0031DD6894